MVLLFILIFLLYQISCDKIEDGILTKGERYSEADLGLLQHPKWSAL